MKSTLLIILLIFPLHINIASAQQNKTSQSSSEIDQLYKEYKDKKYISIYTLGKDLIGEIKITLNSNLLPQSIEISGTGARLDIAEVFYNLIQQKKAKGYSLYQGENYELGISPKGIEYIAMLMDNFMGGTGFNAIYKKGNMFFKLGSSKETTSYIDFNLQRQTTTIYTFSLINEDYSRKGTNDKTNFKF